MNGFERRRKEKMDAILSAAFELLVARGVRAVTIADIANRAQVSQVTIYNYFGSKDGLVKQVLFTWTDQKMREAEGVLASDLPFREKFEKLAFPDDPDVRQFLQECYQTRAMPFLVRLIEEGKREGRINPALSTEAVLLWTDIVWKAVSRPDFCPSLNQKVSADLNELFYYGLLGKPVPELEAVPDFHLAAARSRGGGGSEGRGQTHEEVQGTGE